MRIGALCRAEAQLSSCPGVPTRLHGGPPTLMSYHLRTTEISAPTFLCRESLRRGPDAIPGNLVARAVQTLPHVDPDERGNNESVVSEAYQSMDLHLFAVRYKRSTFTSTPDILSRYPRSDLLWTLRVRQRASVPARACVSQSACSLCTSQYRTSLPTEIPIHQCGAAVGVRSGKMSVAAWP